MLLNFKILIGTFLLAFISCSEDDNRNCLGFETENVSTVDSPETGKVNEQVEMLVTFNARNGCGEFERFVESGNDFSRTIETIVRYEGCVCAEYIQTITTTYTFTPEAPGEYEFQFKSGENDYITVNLHIS